MRELQGPLGVDGRSAEVFSRRTYAVAMRGMAEDTLATGVARTLGQLQAPCGMACSRAKARLNWVSQGQRRGRCKVRRRAERVIRPTRAKTRRLRVLVITVRSPRPIRAVQRARRHHLDRQPGAVGGEAPRRHVVQLLEVARSRPRRGGDGPPASVSRSVMKACIWRRGRAGNRVSASPAGQ